MPITLYESSTQKEKENGLAATSIVTGFVINNCDVPAGHGKILVRIPALNQEVLARMTAPGAGSNSGLLYIPRVKDEVLVALNQNDPTDAFILGGLWSTLDRPPSDPVQMTTKRVFRTGLTPAVGHEVEFDDALQSIKITTSLTPLGQQSITLDPTGIEMKNLAGTIKITMDNTTQTITVQAAKSIELKALGQIKLQAANIDIQGTVLTKIAGGMVKIN